MAHILTDSPGFPDVVTPDDGDNLQASSVEVGFQALADRTRLHNGFYEVMVGAGGTQTLVVDALWTGTHVFDDGLQANAASFINHVLEVQNATAFYSKLVGPLEISGAGAFIILKDFSTSGHFTANLSVNFNSGYTSFGDRAYTGGIGRHTGTSRDVRRSVVGANANTTYSPADQQQVIVRSGGITADRDYTISNTGENGDWIRVSCNDPSFQVNVYIPGPLVCSVGGALANQWVEAERVAGTWGFVAMGPLP